MGVAAMTLAGGEYAIHGTNVPGSVGGFVSYGCIRMLNQDIAELFLQVPVGTRVVVIAAEGESVSQVNTIGPSDTEEQGLY